MRLAGDDSRIANKKRYLDCYVDFVFLGISGYRNNTYKIDLDIRLARLGKDYAFEIGGQPMKEQIEEMAVDLCLIDRCKRLPQEECNNTTCAHCEAEALYNAGYRKQKEGEWIKHGYKWRCSNCGSKINIDGTPIENGLYYCSKCGAKMKGGAE